MPDNTINWGQGAVENTNDWGKGKTNSANNWGKVYETSPSGDTNIEGGLALTITYSANAYCDGIGDTPQPTVAGNTGSGTFSSTTGLTINSSTGIIDVDASTKGATYLVTYTDTDSDTATANITLNDLDNAAFAYSASSYEPTDADPTPTITGLTGGTFSSTSGLVFVDSGTNTGSSTGEIDLSATTIASYTITYDTTSSGSSVCPNTSTQTVEVAVATLSNNYSIEFDEVDDFINAGTLSDMNGATEFSISFWFKSDLTFANQGIVFGNRDANNSNYGLAFAFGRNWTKATYIYLNSPSVSTLFVVPTYTFSSNINIWTHIAFTYDGATFKLYIDNGTPLTLSSSGFTFVSGSNDFNIGKDSWSSIPANSKNYGGKLDEFAIWNTDLTSTQVSEIYNATGTNVTERLSDIESSNLKVWYRMGDGDTFPTVTDNAGSNDGTMTNMASSDIVNDTPS